MNKAYHVRRRSAIAGTHKKTRLKPSILMPNGKARAQKQKVSHILSSQAGQNGV
ncbi:hypothetical protein NE562_13640 [Butyricicoccus faecihominis]|uniref:hypothetical protein n=1 Tax=Butyricicoccus faecihominis TaxID=1712515 RepID=UPI00247A47F6|nr:hypothetical protein [Butyricicoccus faecihominis]MCQ5130711.1 hypothetical protein [Butyricicoccus faecihominis]